MNLLLAAALAATPAPGCAPRRVFVEMLASTWGEMPVRWRLGRDGNLIEEFESRAGTFTFLLTTPYGCSQVVAAGKDGGENVVRPAGDPS